MPNYGYVKDKSNNEPYHYNLNVNLTTIDGYTPRNKKCFCYPYNVIRLSINNGSSIIYKPEYFNDLTDVNFSITIDYKFIFSLQPKLCAYVKGYRGIERYQKEMAILNDFPSIPYLNDTYKNWYALNKNSLTQNYIAKGIDFAIGIGSLALGVNGLASGMDALSNIPTGLNSMQFESYMKSANNAYETGKQSAFGGAISALHTGNSIASQMANVADMKNQPNHVVGLPQGNEMVFTGATGIWISQETCRLEYIEMIDNYFTRFGYQVNTTKAITITNRENFDYVQTTDCNITGNIPQEDIEELEAIFNNGVTIWHNENTYGDWNVSNRGRGDM